MPPLNDVIDEVLQKYTISSEVRAKALQNTIERVVVPELEQVAAKFILGGHKAEVSYGSSAALLDIPLEDGPKVRIVFARKPDHIQVEWSVGEGLTQTAPLESPVNPRTIQKAIMEALCLLLPQS